jgi:hypothetical protein
MCGFSRNNNPIRGVTCNLRYGFSQQVTALSSNALHYLHFPFRHLIYENFSCNRRAVLAFEIKNPHTLRHAGYVLEAQTSQSSFWAA